MLAWEQNKKRINGQTYGIKNDDKIEYNNVYKYSQEQ